MDTTQIDLLSLIERDTRLKKVAGTNGGEWAGPCPFCGGKDRFRVWAFTQKPSAWCRGCGFSGDAIAYVMRRDAVAFTVAVETLGIALEQQRRQPPKPRAPEPPVNTSDLKEAACFDPAWQLAADQFLTECFFNLQDNWETSRAARYLESRGIGYECATAFDLGANPQSHKATWGPVEVWLPRGIVIPWHLDKAIWNIRIRRPNADLKDGENKYIPPAGVSNGLFEGDLITPKSDVVIVEGEFDAMLINWLCKRAGLFNVLAVATGGTTGARLLRWVTRVSLARRVLVAFDSDENGAGDNAAEYWLTAIGRKAQRLVPTQHDPTDMWKAGEDVVGWIANALYPRPVAVEQPMNQTAMFGQLNHSYRGGM